MKRVILLCALIVSQIGWAVIPGGGASERMYARAAEQQRVIVQEDVKKLKEDNKRLKKELEKYLGSLTKSAAKKN